MKKTLLALAACLALVPLSAGAEVFVWKDPAYDIKVTYPDNWMRQSQLDEELRLFVLAPQGLDHAACRLYSTHDARYMDAPAYAQQDVSAAVFTSNQLRQEMYNRPDTGDIRLMTYSKTGAFGSGAAITADFSFTKNWAGQGYPMRARMLATQYAGNHIVMTCETLATAWGKWENTMKNIFASVRFPAAFTREPNGLYRPFDEDGDVYLPLNRRKDAYTLR